MAGTDDLANKQFQSGGSLLDECEIKMFDSFIRTWLELVSGSQTDSKV